METINSLQMNEIFFDRWVETIRSYYAFILDMYLKLYKKYDQLKAESKDDKLKMRIYKSDVPFYDENGKINWEIIRQLIPLNVEKDLNDEFACLNNNERRLCCLLFFKVQNKTISQILPYRTNSIYPTKRRIRQKTNAKDLNDIFRWIAWKCLSK